MHGLLTPRRAELVVFVGLILLFLVVNLATSARSPLIWQDEVMFADPAVNLALGHGFTTSAWFQDRTSVFAGNSPLYSLILAGWIRLFGFEVVAVRALNYVLVVAVVATALLALHRLGLVRSVFPRLIFTLLVFCGDGVTFSYRSGRYDCLHMLIVAFLFLTFASSAPRARAAGAFLLGVAAPWGGLQILPYLALLGVVVLLARGKAAIVDVVAVGAGCIAGMACLAAFLLRNGVWREFLKSVSVFSGSSRSLAERLIAAGSAPYTESSSTLLLLALALLLVSLFRKGNLGLRSPVAMGCLVGVAVPCCLAFSGRYPRYYAWMAFLPMAACLSAQMQRSGWGSMGRAVPALLFLACAVGLPARLAATLRQWDLRDPAPVGRLVMEQVKPQDRVYCDYQAYYPVKKKAAVVFLPPYAGLSPEMKGVAPPISAADRAAVNVLIVTPDTVERAIRFFRGRWSLVGGYSALQRTHGTRALRQGVGSASYELRVYRRSPATVLAGR